MRRRTKAAKPRAKTKKAAPRKRQPRGDSPLEEKMLGQIQELGLPEPIREHRFWPGRRFRFDFAWPDLMVALEVEGGIFRGGRHTSPKGYSADCLKYSNAAIFGWTVIRVTSPMITSGEALELIERALREKAA